MTTVRTETVIVGAGQAGLAVGYELARRGRSSVILDAHERIGDSWRTRWDSLRLFTPARYDGLPGWRFPASAWTYPTKDEVADYLEAYAARFDLDVRTGVRVEQVSRDDDRFVVSAPDRTIRGGPGRGGDRWLSGAQDPAVRLRPDPGHPPAALQRVPEPVAAAARSCAGGRSGQLRRRDRGRGLIRPPHLVVRAGHRTGAGPSRELVGSPGDTAVLVRALPRADGREPAGSQGSPGPLPPRAPVGEGQEGRPRRCRRRARAAGDRRGERPADSRWTAGRSIPPLSSGAPASPRTTPGSTSPFWTPRANRCTSVAWSSRRPGCTSWACSSSTQGRRPWWEVLAGTLPTSPRTSSGVCEPNELGGSEEVVEFTRVGPWASPVTLRPPSWRPPSCSRSTPTAPSSTRPSRRWTARAAGSACPAPPSTPSAAASRGTSAPSRPRPAPWP